MASSKDQSTPYTLYYGTFSMFSTMVRMTYAMRGSPRPEVADMSMIFEVIDIGPVNPQHLTENYLRNINPLGKVPVLTHPILLSEPLPESLAISKYLEDRYPSLAPPEHQNTIRELLEKLHEINVTVLTFGPNSVVQQKTLGVVNKLLQSDDISDEYRRALLYKRTIIQQGIESLSQEALTENEERTKVVLNRLLDVTYSDKKSGQEFGYIFGSEPTVLDAHMLVFLCRIYDLKRTDLIPSLLITWVEGFRKTAFWSDVVPGGTTLPPSISSR